MIERGIDAGTVESPLTDNSLMSPQPRLEYNQSTTEPNLSFPPSTASLPTVDHHQRITRRPTAPGRAYGTHKCKSKCSAAESSAPLNPGKFVGPAYGTTAEIAYPETHPSPIEMEAPLNKFEAQHSEARCRLESTTLAPPHPATIHGGSSSTHCCEDIESTARDLSLHGPRGAVFDSEDNAGQEARPVAAHKVPPGASTYARAKRMQLVAKNMRGAESLLREVVQEWGYKADSALKDLVVVLKQQNRQAEAAEIVGQYRHKCDRSSQVSLDNMLLDIYRALRLYPQQVEVIQRLLEAALENLEMGAKHWTSRRNNIKTKVSLNKRIINLYSSLGWALMHLTEWDRAEDAYASAQRYETEGLEDSDLRINQAVCLMRVGRLVQAQTKLLDVAAVSRGICNKSYKAVGGSQLASVQRSTCALQELETIYEQQLSELRSALQQQEQVHIMLQSIGLTDKPDTDTVDNCQGAVGDQGKRKVWNRGTRGHGRDGDSKWAEEVLSRTKEVSG